MNFIDSAGAESVVMFEQASTEINTSRPIGAVMVQLSVLEQDHHDGGFIR